MVSYLSIYTYPLLDKICIPFYVVWKMGLAKNSGSEIKNNFGLLLTEILGTENELYCAKWWLFCPDCNVLNLFLGHHYHYKCHMTACQLVRDMCGWPENWLRLRCTVYPKKYAHGFVVICFFVVMQSFITNSHEVFIHIHQGCFAGNGAIVRLPQCQWSKPDGYGKISQCITTTKHSKAKTVCIFLGIYCIELSCGQSTRWFGGHETHTRPKTFGNSHTHSVYFTTSLWLFKWSILSDAFMCQ